jgi:NitT/TauT family transport system ATP-binding protein
MSGAPELSATSLAIAADGVHLSFDGTHLVLSDVTLNVRQGEFVSLVGPAGAAKPRC